jgi:hypothetical protein
MRWVRPSDSWTLLVGLLLIGATASAGAIGQRSPAGEAPGEQGNQQQDEAGQITGIVGLCNSFGQQVDHGATKVATVGLNDILWVFVSTRADETGTLAMAAGCKGITGGTASTAPRGAAGAPQSSNLASGGSTQEASAAQVNPTQYVLLLNGHELHGIEPPVYDSSRHALGFRLTRVAANREVWTRLLGSPTSLSRQVDVSLRRIGAGEGVAPPIAGVAGSGTLRLRIMSGLQLAIAAMVAVCVILLVLGHARSGATLRDGLLPQLEAKRQTYSLGRCQMAFWFVLVFVSFVFLYIALWDYNTVSGQALWLMGISSATALCSIEVDVLKDSPADAVNRALQALGLNTYDDVKRLDEDIAARVADRAELEDALRGKRREAQDAENNARAAPDDEDLAAKALALAKAVADMERSMAAYRLEIQDRQNVKQTFEQKIKPFVTQGWFQDLTTDINGPTLHRLQSLFWTLAIGVVFVIAVYRDLSMPPDLSPTLLALMGISGAGYVGFKYPERNN